MNNLKIRNYLKPANIPCDIWLALPPGMYDSMHTKRSFTQTIYGLIVKIKSYFIVHESFSLKNISKRFFFQKNVLLLNPKY